MSDETTKNPHEEEALGKAYDGRLARRLAGYLRPYRGRVLAGVVLLMFGSLVELAGPLLTATAVDWYIPKRDYAGLNLLAAGYVACLLLAFGLAAANTYLMQMLGQYVQYDLRQQIFAKLQRIDVSYYDRNPVGRLITRLTGDVDALNELFTSGFVAIFGDIITLSAITIVLFVFDWRLACVTLVILPAMLMVTAWFRRGAREGFRKVRLRIARINSFVQEHVSGMSVVQLFGREKLELGRFDRINDEHRVANIETIFYYAVFFPAIEVISSAGIALILWYGGGRVLTSAMTLGALIAFIQYAQRFYQPIRDLSDKYNILQAAMAASERIFNLLDEKPAITSPEKPAAVAPRALGRIEFRNVWFAYKGEDWVLRDVSFTVEPGQSVGVVGHTGAGKTTLTNLLLRFYDIQKGQILLDGVDVREYDLSSLRRNFSIVLQDVYLFSGSVRHNITLGNPDIPDELVRRSAAEVHADSFIRELPDGYDTAIHERGAGLSVGQKQLISFARALAYDPPILILDEATSSIDSETELLIRDAVVRLMDGRTSVIVAHRLSTIQRVDKIMVMHKGELREEGSHQELLAKRGLYYRLYELQYRDQEIGDRAPAMGD